MTEFKKDNQLIAKFLGLTQNSTFEYITHVGACHPNAMKYDTKWDWLMIIIDKISNLHVKSIAPYNGDLYFTISIVNGHTKIEGTGERIFHTSGSSSMLNATYLCVIDFINWYNSYNQ